MKPPIFAEILLMALAGGAEAECIAGDLEEEFALLRNSRGDAPARRWYTRQVIRSGCALLRLRIRSGELTAVVLLASLGVGAPLLLLERLWQFVYSQIPLKDGLHRAPEFLIFNAMCGYACGAALGALAGSRSRGILIAFVAAVSTLAAVSVDSANLPVIYIAALVIGVPAIALLTSLSRV